MIDIKKVVKDALPKVDELVYGLIFGLPDTEPRERVYNAVAKAVEAEYDIAQARQDALLNVPDPAYGGYYANDMAVLHSDIIESEKYDADFDLSGRFTHAPAGSELRQVTSGPKATLVGSFIRGHGGDYIHKPVIDLDVPVRLVPSSTPGHSHLYIDKEMTDEQYRNLLTALVEAGVVERGILHQFRNHKETFVRLPWVRKFRSSDQPF